MKSATSEAASWGPEVAVGRPVALRSSPGECKLRSAGQGRLEEAQEASWGTAEEAAFDQAGAR